MQASVFATAPACASSRLLAKPYRRRARSFACRALSYAPAAAVNPLLPLWQQPVVHNAALKAAATAGASFIAASLLSALVGKVARKEYGPLQSVDNARIEEEKAVPLRMFETAIVAVQKPLKFLLRVVAGVVTIREIADFLRVTLEAHAEHEHIAPGWVVGVLGKAMAGLDHAGYLALEATEVAFIFFGVWVALRMKDNVVSGILKSRVQDKHTDSISDKAFEQVVLPLSGMGSWAVVVSGVLMSLHVLGINLAPLLTVGGISGIVVGLSAQAVLGNMVSGLNLYISRPFVAGERVDIMTGSGGKVLSAFVEEVSPMRTHLRDDHWRPYVIPNKVLAELIISNESRIIESNSVSFYNRMRSFKFTATIRYQDFDKLDGILKDYKQFMSQCPDIDKTLPAHVHLSGFVEEGLQIHVHVGGHALVLPEAVHTAVSLASVKQVHSTPSASRRYASFKQEMLLQLGACVKKNGADFAWKDHVEFTSAIQEAAESNGDPGKDMTAELVNIAAATS